jgi:PAS domain S-box-containing protein
MKYLSGAATVFRLRGPLSADSTARILNLMLWALTLWFGIWGVVLLPFHFKDRFWSMQNQVVTDAALIYALVLLRRGRFRAATFTYLGAIWIFTTHVMALSGGVRSNVQVLYVTLPISAAWLLGYRAAVWVASLCMSCTLTFAVLELVHLTLPRRIPGTPLGAWAVFGMACLIGALPVAQILRDLRSALDRSREAEEEARRAMEESRRATEQLQIEIAEHTRAEQALRESEQRFRIAADTAPVMIWIRDVDQHTTFLNKVWSDFTGRTREEGLGVGWAESVHPDDLGRCQAELSAAYASHKDYRFRFRLRRADGEYRLMFVHGVPRFGLDRSFSGYIASCVDVTDLERAQEQALSGQKWESLGVLATGIAHDFNNLLGSIGAQSELMMEEVQDSSLRESISRIQSVVMRASEIVRQLMVYAGQESGTMGEVDVAALAREMLALVNVSTTKNAVVQVALPAGVPLIRANAAQIRQVLLNLVTNASEALRSDAGVITVRLSEVRLDESSSDAKTKPRDGRYLRLEVSDTGCGMTEQIRARIFDPFFTTKGPGRGLGLAAVQGIVHSHGGEISVHSAPGRGTRFEVLLPSASTAVEQVPVRREALNRPRKFEGTVLIIEDEEVLRTAVAKMLRAKGIRVLEAGDGIEALELFRGHAAEIDITVLDVTLPGLPSRVVLQKLRERLDPANVIVTSAFGREQALSTVCGEHRQLFIRKPYGIDELLDVIEKVQAGKPESL